MPTWAAVELVAQVVNGRRPFSSPACLRTQSVHNEARMEVVEVGVREFREKLSEYLLHSGKAVAVTRHGATVGYFIPTRAERGAERLRALREAGAAVDAMLAQASATEEDIDSVVQEFAVSCKAKASGKRPSAARRRR